MVKKILSIVVPCYNEEESIKFFLKETKCIENKLVEEVIFEYIFIDDGSTDNTLEELKNVCSQYENVNFISFSRNFGKEAAILAGLKEAKGELITVMDVDLQDPPELLAQMIQTISTGYDIVGTRRETRTGEPVIRSFFANMFYYLISKISHTEMVSGARDFRMMTRQVVDSVLELSEVNRFSKGLFSWVGYKVTYISFENRERVSGETSWNFWSLFKYSIDGIVNFSEVPLSLATWIGSIFSLLSFAGITFVVLRKLFFDGSIEGWTSIVSIILLVSGVQLLSLGIIGKYLSKIFLETKKRPVYIIRERSK